MKSVQNLCLFQNLICLAFLSKSFCLYSVFIFIELAPLYKHKIIVKMPFNLSRMYSIGAIFPTYSGRLFIVFHTVGPETVKYNFLFGVASKTFWNYFKFFWFKYDCNHIYSGAVLLQSFDL